MLKKIFENKLDAFKTYLLASGKSKETVRQYVSKINRFLSFVKKDTVTKNDVIRFFAYIRESKSKCTYSVTYFALKEFFKFCRKEYLLKDIPAPKRPRTLPKYLTLEEVKALLDHTGSIRDRAIILTLFTTGLRVSELCNLKIKDVDFKRGIIRVYRPKTESESEIPVADFTLFALRELVNEYDKRGPEDPLFQNRFGEALTPRTVQRILQKAKERAKINKKVTPHVLRHSFATFSLQHGLNLAEIQEILGHANINTTRVYSHVVKTELEKKYHNIFSKTKKEEEEEKTVKKDVRLLYCPNCGVKVSPHWKYCVNCGEDLTNL